MKWTVTFYNEKVENQTLALPAGILANLLHIIELVEEFGPSIGRPHTAPLGKGLFEIRAKGPEGIGRSLFCTIEGHPLERRDRRDLRRPKGRTPSFSSSTCMINSIRNRIALAFLERGIDPGSLLTPLLEPENLHDAATKDRLATQKPQGNLTLARHRPPSPSGPAGETWPGENVDEPSLPQAQTATLFSKLSVMLSSLDTSIKHVELARKRMKELTDND